MKPYLWPWLPLAEYTLVLAFYYARTGCIRFYYLSLLYKLAGFRVLKFAAVFGCFILLLLFFSYCLSPWPMYDFIVLLEPSSPFENIYFVPFIFADLWSSRSAIWPWTRKLSGPGSIFFILLLLVLAYWCCILKPLCFDDYIISIDFWTLMYFYYLLIKFTSIYSK